MDVGGGVEKDAASHNWDEVLAPYNNVSAADAVGKEFARRGYSYGDDMRQAILTALRASKWGKVRLLMERAAREAVSAAERMKISRHARIT